MFFLTVRIFSLKLSTSTFNSTKSSSLESKNAMSYEAIVVRAPPNASKINLFLHYAEKYNFYNRKDEL